MLHIALAAFLLAPAAAHAQAAPEETAASREKAATDLALARGRLIYAYDQAAWHGTDDLLVKIEEPEKKVGGWIVDGSAEAPTLVFFDQDPADPHAVYVAQFRDNKLVSGRLLGARDNRTLSPERKAMVAARRKGLEAWNAAKPLFCAKRSANSVVLPPERAGGPYLVYIMTPQAENGAYPFGGHFRVEIGADGSVGASRSFANTCLTVPVPADGKTAMFVTHLLDPIPTEIHVFTALAAHHPIAVGTRDKRVWWVTGGEIKLMELN